MTDWLRKWVVTAGLWLAGFQGALPADLSSTLTAPSVTTAAGKLGVLTWKGRHCLRPEKSQLNQESSVSCSLHADASLEAKN